MVEFNLTCFAVVCAPAVAMLLGSVAVFFIKVSPRVQAVFQMFSAGLLISAVANEVNCCLQLTLMQARPNLTLIPTACSSSL